MNPLLLVVALALSPHRPVVASGPPPILHTQTDISMLAWCDVWRQPTIMVTNNTRIGVAVSWTLMASGTVISPGDWDAWSDVSLLGPRTSTAWMSPVSSLRLVISYLDSNALSSGQTIEVSCP